MRKFLFIGFVALSIFGTSTALAGAPNVTDFPYLKDVILPQLSWTAPVSIDLDDTTMGAMTQRLSNIDIYDSENEEVAFEAYYNEFGRYNDVRVHSTSSQKTGTINDLIDNDPFTTFGFDERVDRTDASWAILDLGSPQRIVRAKVFVPEGRVRYMEIKGGMTTDNMRTLLSKRAHIWQSDFHSPLIRYVKISLWGVGVKVDDIKLYHGDKAILYFKAEPKEKYRVLYGGATDLIRYKVRHAAPIQTKATMLEGKLTKGISNPSFPKDFDGDGFNNELDNCPFVSNASQTDSDKDHVGNKCDNASKVKNSNQHDTDFDGVGDVEDNCMLIPNEKQKDRDDDGYGNACDSAHGGEDVDWEIQDYNTTIMAFVLGFILAAGVVIGWKKREWVEKIVRKLRSRK
jgi:hypothetical protein